MSLVDTGAGTPQTGFVPDAARQASITQSFFYTLGDIFGGSDVSARVNTSNGNAVDVAVDATGVPYVRGTTMGLMGPLNPSLNGTVLDNQPAGFTVTPGMLLAGVVAVLLITHKGK